MSEKNRKPPAAEVSISNLTMKGIMEVVDNSFESLVVQHERKRLPEPVFRAHFLPHFTGQPNLDSASNPFTNWIAVAGSPTAMVDVINEGGEVLFTVPPMMDSTIINLNQVGGKRLNDLIVELKLHGESIPGAADRFYNTTFQKKLATIAPGHVDDTDATKAWRKIFKHYGIEGDGTDSGEEKQSNGSEDLEYD